MELFLTVAPAIRKRLDLGVGAEIRVAKICLRLLGACERARSARDLRSGREEGGLQGF